ncbi:ABC transporter permease [Treponema phagedenis]|uniref:ABC transporter permease n=1 Tax=Treponema phagedenis TaxID=162 RepID=UPI0001F6416C|nr:ABC transporter permease [Treponema phagedenis]EFW38360.1 branched-chain amino acid ABC transporter, permease protein [Treponema phagedenis F0421]TYT78538.1 ABC transporter permease [Treponema phagedenis]
MKRFLTSVVAFAVGLAVISILILCTAQNPLSTLASFFLKPFYSQWYFGNMLNKMGLLLCASIGAIFALKTGNFNLGGEGQIYIAGLLTAVLLKSSRFSFSLPQFVLVFFIAGLAAGVFGMFCGLLKIRFGISELLSSFLLSAASLPIIDYLIIGPVRDTSGNLLATAPIENEFFLTQLLPPSYLNGSFVFSIVLCIAVAIFFSRTSAGYRLQTGGKAPEFAFFSGFSVYAPSLWGMFASAFFHGLVGFFAVTGTWHLCHLGFSAGIGWAALAIALIARLNVYALIPASFLYAWVESASDTAVMSGTMQFNTAIFLQASIFLLISAEFFTRKKFPREPKPESGVRI